MRMIRLSLLLLILGWTPFVIRATAWQARRVPRATTRQVDFVRDIEPIFRNSCHSCHGPEKPSSNLRLDNKQAAFEGGLSGKSIIPGKGEESLLYRRVAGLGDDAQMPLKGDKLTPAQIRAIRDWINQGAQWPDAPATAAAEVKKHWAYVKPTRPDPPAVRNQPWVRNPIDNFILARLETEGLSPSPEASKERLIRRVSLDLTGLPPTLAEVDAFLADSSPDAYEKLVDRLLASPRYGERWARPWLDLARYADTNGYEKDNRRSIWLYRDWVIQALNKDLPFDRFTIDQIAGDLLPNATLEQRVATGFHRNTMINEEGGVDPEEYRVAAIVDRVDTTATVWLGTTLACAQCHNHKYDPFSQEEYYRFFAFFNNTEAEVQTLPGNERTTRGPNLTVPAPRELARQRSQLVDQIAKLEEVLKTQTPDGAAEQAKLHAETQALLFAWTDLDPIQSTSAAGASLTRLADKSLLAGGRSVERETYVLQGVTGQSHISAVRLEVLPDPSLPNAGLSRSGNGNFVLTGFEVEIAPEGSPESSQSIKLVDAVSQHGSTVRGALDDDPTTGWTFRADRVESVEETQAIFLPDKPFGFERGTRIAVRLRHESAAPQQIIGRFRLSLTSAENPQKSARVPVKIQRILALPEAARPNDWQQTVGAYYRSISPLLNPIILQLASLRAQWVELSSPSTLVMKELAEARKTHIHVRGNFLTKGKEVVPGVPGVLHALANEQQPNRLTLARWLVDENNPLVARVAVNRFWMQYFGRGIVETAEDFGRQGQLPTHPELLDWLATEFMRQKWSMKALHRLIVTSATYRQSSQLNPNLLERDPANRLRARGPRLRLEAEMIRDNALSIAGLLSQKIGGPSVFPLQPEGVWNLVYNDDKWVASTGEDRYRRGLYTFWRRTAPYPSFMTFDAPSREAICTRRVSTNTPLQSLTTLNDPTFFDAARGLARRIMGEAPPDVAESLIYAFRLCTARAPDSKELARLTVLFEQEYKQFSQSLERARIVARSGDVTSAENADIARFAAWTMVANVLLNLDETLTKG